MVLTETQTFGSLPHHNNTLRAHEGNWAVQWNHGNPGGVCVNSTSAWSFEPRGGGGGGGGGENGWEDG